MAGDPNDKPGVYRVVAVNGFLKQAQADFNQAEADGFKFVAMNDQLAVFYKETPKANPENHLV